MSWIEPNYYYYFSIRLCWSGSLIEFTVLAEGFPNFDFSFGKFGLWTFVHLFSSVVKVIALKFGQALNCSMVSEYSNTVIIDSIKFYLKESQFKFAMKTYLVDLYLYCGLRLLRDLIGSLRSLTVALTFCWRRN